MRRKNHFASVSIVLLLLSVSLILGATFYVPNDPWVWSIEVGDEFIFLVDYHSWNNPSFADHYEIQFTVFVKTKITSLPNISVGLNPDIFASQILDHLKSETIFQNGSSIILPWGTLVNTLISKSILPIGNWLKLQSFYDTPPPTSFPMNVVRSYFYTSLLSDSFLVTSGRGDFYHETCVYTSYVNLTKGVPLNITDFSSYAWCDGSQYGHRITIWIS